MRDEPKVTHVVMDTETGLTVEIIVERSPGDRPMIRPSPYDVPQDIRDALKIWLAGNQL